MKNERRPIGSLLAMLFPILAAQGCIVGTVMDSSGTAVPDADVVAVASCAGDGCEAHRTEITIGSETYTGYRSTTDGNGHYFYDPYAEVVAPEDAMMLYIPEGAADQFIRFRISKSGYQDILLQHLPQYETHTHPDTGKTYAIAEVPEMYLCRDDEIDSDGDNICDESEKQYGTSPANVDTDGDGVNDDVEIFQTGTPPGDLQQCVFAYCQDDLFACLGDTECNGWLTCMEECPEGDILCPTQCGAFFQSPVIDSFSQCALDNGCAFVEFPDLPLCDLPEAPMVSVGNVDGFWWVSAIKGHEYVLYDDCQRFILNELNATEIDVENSTLVTYKEETRVAINDGLFTRTAEGYLELVYENWAGYTELYHPYHVSPNVMVMHVCSVGTDNVCHDYGTLILTRVPLESLSSEESAAMDAALQNVFQTTLADYRLIRTSECPNGPTP